MHVGPVGEQPLGVAAAGERHVLHDRHAHEIQIVGVHERLEIDHLAVAALREVASRDRARTRCRRSCRPRSCGRCGPSTTTRPPVMYSQPWSPTPSTTTFAPLFRTQNRSPGDAADIRFAARRAVEGHVADDDVLLGSEGGTLRRIRDQPAARQPLAESVVGIAHQRHRHAARHERAEALSGRAGEGDLDRVVGQASRRRTAA